VVNEKPSHGINANSKDSLAVKI